MASITERSGRFWVRWKEGGKDRSITVSSRKAAERLKIEVEDEVARTGRYEPRRPGEATALGVILADYIRYSAREHQPNTTDRYAQVLELFKRWMGEDAPVTRLSYALLGEYHEHLRRPETGRHLHRRGEETCRKHIQTIEVFWQWAWTRQARGAYQGVPQPDSLELQRQPPPHKLAATWADMDAVIGVSDGWLHDLYLVLRCTGLRVQQALELRWDDLRLEGEAGWAHIRPELGKSKQERRGRWVPLGSESDLDPDDT